MSRAEFMRALAILISPRSPERCAVLLATMVPLLDDIPDAAFTDASLVALAGKLKRSPTLPQVRAELEGWLRAQKPPDPVAPVTSEQDQLEADRAHFAAEWDDPVGILAAVRKCEGHLGSLRFLGLILARHAPQHLSLLPPHVIEVLTREGTPHMRRVFASQFVDMPRGKLDNDLGRFDPPRQDEPRPLSPEQLDRLNPLPDGRKRAAPTPQP